MTPQFKPAFTVYLFVYKSISRKNKKNVFFVKGGGGAAIIEFWKAATPGVRVGRDRGRCWRMRTSYFLALRRPIVHGRRPAHCILPLSVGAVVL